MRGQKSQSLKVQLALLAHIYKLELIELCEMTGRWLLGVAEDLYMMVWLISRYTSHHHRRHR